MSLLKGFVVILYDKAVLEPNFIGMYAQMCERLAKDLPELSDEDGVLPFGQVLVGMYTHSHLHHTPHTHTNGRVNYLK